MTVGEMKHMLEPFRDDKPIKFKEVIEIQDVTDDYTEEVCDLDVVSTYGREMCIIELKEI